MIESRITYFENTGAENTENTLEIARKRAQELGIKTILVSSTTGASAVKAMKVLKGFRVIVVSHAQGFDTPNVQKFTEENRRAVQSAGGTVHTATHPFAAIDRAARVKFNMYLEEELIAGALRTFGQGAKVAIEICMMAADGGLVKTDEDVIAIAGTSGGLDTALVLKPVNTWNFFDVRVREILCKPRF